MKSFGAPDRKRPVPKKIRQKYVDGTHSGLIAGNQKIVEMIRRMIDGWSDEQRAAADVEAAEIVATEALEAEVMRGDWHQDRPDCWCSRCMCETQLALSKNGIDLDAFVVSMTAEKRLGTIGLRSAGRALTGREERTVTRLVEAMTDTQLARVVNRFPRFACWSTH